MKQEIIDAIWTLRKNSTSAYLSYVDAAGYPVTRAMLVLEHDLLGTQYFSTNTSSCKVSAILNNHRTAVYYCEPGSFQGVLFAGEMEVCKDAETKEFLWRDGFEKYYSLGVTDPDYCVLKFKVHHVSHYHGLQQTKFLVQDEQMLLAQA
jgi:pyridoxamine 5'-phosphate oxidase